MAAARLFGSQSERTEKERMAHKILRRAIRHQTAVELTASRGFTEIAPLTKALLCSHWNSSVCPEKCPPVLDYLQDIVN